MDTSSSFEEIGNNNALPVVSSGIFDIPQVLLRPPRPSLRRINLEMCTEGLGSENGARICETVDELFSLLLEDEKSPPSSSGGGRRSKKVNRTPRSLPPPLSSMSGCNGVRVRPRRDGGRLVMTAVTACMSSFVMERSGGRLRLWLRNAGDYKTNANNVVDEEEEEEKGGGACLDASGDTVISPSSAAAPAGKGRCMESDPQNNEKQISWSGSQPCC